MSEKAARRSIPPCKFTCPINPKARGRKAGIWSDARHGLAVELRLGIAALQTLSVVAIVYGCQATTYAIRERRHLLGLRPTVWLVSSSVADILIISILALCGLAMAPLPISVIACEFAAAIVFGLILDGLKIPIFARLKIA